MNVSIKKRIYWSFFLLVFLFVANGIASLITLNNNRKLSEHVSIVINPSLQSLENLEDLLIVSKMYTTNWVFLRSNQDDKDALKRLHEVDYPTLKVKLNLLSGKWDNKHMVDSLNKIYTGFEQLLVIEKGIMSSLNKFEDYDDPVAKLESERIIEDELFPRTSSLINALTRIVLYEQNIRTQKNQDLEESFKDLRMMITVLAITIICMGIFLSLYMARVIINPINKIRHIINDLGKGIIRKVNYKIGKDEIGDMVRSVNNLSENLQATATFATAVGNRSFDSYFEPLSSEDTLGKALIAMRDNIKSSYQKLNEAQHIAKLGSWERDVINDHVSLSDELFCIFDMDPVSFDSRFQTISQLIHPEDMENFKAVGKKYMQDHLPAAYECRIISAKGITKNISVQSQVVLDANGEVIKTIGIVQDITERKKADIALLESREQIQTIYDAVLDAVIIIDEEGKIAKWDSKSELLFGWKQDEVLGMALTETIIPHQHREGHKRGMKHFLKTGEGPILSKTIEVRALKKNNDEFDVSLSISPSFINGRYQFIGFIRDITSRKKAEVELHKSEERYRQIVETSQEGIWLVDENNKTIFVNKKMCEMFEYSQDEMLGEEIFHFMEDDWKQKGADAMAIIRTGTGGKMEFRFITKSGKYLWTNLSVNAVFDDAGIYKGALAMVTDITKRKHDEELIQKSQLTLERNNLQLERKNKELEQFAYVASHDLQEPLRTITSFVQIFKQQYLGKFDSKSDKYLTYIVQASDRMRVLIKDLLDYSRIGNNKDLEQVDSAIILHDVITDIDKAVKDSHAEIKADHLPVISGYTTELKQLFQNLIVNSIKFRKKDKPLKINITAQKKNDYWQFAFTDNGIGIDKDHNERIFIIFQRLHTRSEYEGSGIGLSHCKKIVELHQGKIWVESTPGEGSTFYFTIHSPKQKINETKIELHNAN